jgi:uncharacterized protein YgiM (DUF1202 family)
MRRSLPLVLAVSLLCSAGTAGAAFPVSDVGDPKVYPAVERLVARGLVTGRDENGKATGLYRPNENITLAEALRMSMIAAKYQFPRARVPSNISAQGTWASGYVNAAELGRFRAFMDNRTDVFRPATRTEVIQTLSDAYRITPGKIASYGITTTGNSPVTRGQFAVILSPLLSLTPGPVTVASTPTVPPPVVSSASSVSTSPSSVSAPGSSAPAASSAASSVAPAPSGGQTGVITSAVNVRWEPDVNAKSRGSYPAGTPVTILDAKYEAWYFIRLPDGKEGYVVKKFVK